MSEKMSVDKQDPTKEDSEASMESSPEGENPPVNTTQENQQPKRKGGRKPVRNTRWHHLTTSLLGTSLIHQFVTILVHFCTNANITPQIYATSEERKQRNRQAQAAFRERRTEYIKQLEEAIRTHEQNLANLQAAHRHAADECLMLRYKNSLLERILLEKGTGALLLITCDTTNNE